MEWSIFPVENGCGYTEWSIFPMENPCGYMEKSIFAMAGSIFPMENTLFALENTLFTGSYPFCLAKTHQLGIIENAGISEMEKS